MHRLKEWFGIKDIPLGEIRTDTTLRDLSRFDDSSVKTDNDSSVKTGNDLSVKPDKSQVMELVKPILEDRKYSSVDLWLRERVPLQPYDCLSCKIISTMVLMGCSAGIFALGVRAYKVTKSLPLRERAWLGMIVTSLGLIPAFASYDRWFDVGFFRPVIEGESLDDRLKRIATEDFESFKRMISFNKQLPPSMKDFSVPKSPTDDSK